MRILIIGCGDVGLRVARLLNGRARLYALTHSPERHAALRAAGITPISGNLDDRRSLRRLRQLADHILHFAPPPGEGETDPRTRRLLATLGVGSVTVPPAREKPPSRPPRGPSHSRGGPANDLRSVPPAREKPPSCPAHGLRATSLVYISTSGVYGDCGGARVSETWPARPSNTRAKRRDHAEKQLRSFGRRGDQGNNHRICILRAPGIYAQDRMPTERVKKGLPAIVATDDVHTNHIHAEDLARISLAALFRGRANRLYNAVDDSGLKMGDWFDVVADHLGLPRPPRLPRAEVIAAVTPAMRTFLTESRRLLNQRAKTELRFKFRYPSVREGLKHG